MTFGALGTLAMGWNFNVASLTRATASSTHQHQQCTSATFEVINGARVTQNQSSFAVGTLMVGGPYTGASTGTGMYDLNYSSATLSITNMLRIGANGYAGTFNYYAGVISTPLINIGPNGAFINQSSGNQLDVRR